MIDAHAVYHQSTRTKVAYLYTDRFGALELLTEVVFGLTFLGARLREYDIPCTCLVLFENLERTCTGRRSKHLEAGAIGDVHKEATTLAALYIAIARCYCNATCQSLSGGSGSIGTGLLGIVVSGTYVGVGKSQRTVGDVLLCLGIIGRIEPIVTISIEHRRGEERIAQSA